MKTGFQLKQKILQQLNLSLNWSKQAMNENYEFLSTEEIDELSSIRLEITQLMKNIDTNEYHSNKRSS